MPHAPDGSGGKTVWTEADKAGFGTARAGGSDVWFTLRRGRTSEVFYPDPSTPSVRNLELEVTDGRTSTHRESTDTRHRTTRPYARSLGFTQVDTARSGRYRITKRFVTDSPRDALDVHVRLRSLDGGRYRLFALYDPALHNSGGDDTGRTLGHRLVATDGGSSVAASLVSRPRFDRTSNGFARAERRLDGPARRPPPAVRQAGGTATSPRSRRCRPVRPRCDGSTSPRLSCWPPRWTRSTAGRSSAPSAPWVSGDEIDGLSSPSGAYHLVGSRGCYEFGTALWADGDHAAARRVVDFLFDRQQKSDGSFPQNSDVTGRQVWSELQLDETALPIVLARLVGRDDAATYAHVKAADFIAGLRDPDNGRAAPYSPRNAGGTRPATRPTRSRPRSAAWCVLPAWRAATATRRPPRGG